MKLVSTKSDRRGFDDRDLYSGLIRLHILHHAVEGPVFGLGMSEELSRHGYRISAGTLYPLLHGLERKGYGAVPNIAMASRDGESTGQHHRGSWRSPMPKQKFVNY